MGDQSCDRDRSRHRRGGRCRHQLVLSIHQYHRAHQRRRSVHFTQYSWMGYPARWHTTRGSKGWRRYPPVGHRVTVLHVVERRGEHCLLCCSREKKWNNGGAASPVHGKECLYYSALLSTSVSPTTTDLIAAPTTSDLTMSPPVSPTTTDPVSSPSTSPSPPRSSGAPPSSPRTRRADTQASLRWESHSENLRPSPRGQGDSLPSYFRHHPILIHQMTRQGSRRQQLSALPV